MTALADAPRRLAQRGGLLRQAIAFAGVGGVGLVVDVGAFNLLRATVLAPGSVPAGAIWAKVISVTLAIAVNWLGNRTVTFHRSRRVGRTRDVLLEAARFLATSALGSAVAVGALALSHYGLGLTSVLADNIAANVVGLAMGSVVRFVLCRVWVFPVRAEAVPATA